MTVIVGTAGHIDHGKTSLLRALTGIDADRLPEERRRGMTIDVGYAHLSLPDGDAIDFVDVPGHDRLIGNMLVGAGEVDAALMVVAADDGPRAQTLEHLELLDAIGIRHGIAVVTKSDLVPTDRTEAIVQRVRELINRTALAGSAVVVVSAVSGDGLGELRAELAGLRDRVVRDRRVHDAPAEASSGAPVRLAVDRAFSVTGRGVVVTGSLQGGRLDRGSILRLEPGGRTVRARELQVHGSTVDALDGGGRLALNLAGTSTDGVRRGIVLTNDPKVRGTARVLALLRPVARLDSRAAPPTWPLAASGTYRLHLGTASVEARLAAGRRDGAALDDGRAVVTLRLANRIAVGRGDRFVLRVPSPGATAAGGVVLDTAPPVGPSHRRASPDALAALAVAWEAGDAAAELRARVALHGAVTPAADELQTAPFAGVRVAGGWLVDESIAREIESIAEGAVRAHHDDQPRSAGLPLAELRREVARNLGRLTTVTAADSLAIAGALLDGLLATGRVTRIRDLVGLPGRTSAALPASVVAAMDRLERELATPAPPPLGAAARATGCPADGIRALEASGRIVRVEPDLAWAAGTYRDLEAEALRLASASPLTPAALRDATGTSRKYVMALLEDLDRRGVLRRTAEGHVRGPRAPLAPARGRLSVAGMPRRGSQRAGWSGVVLAGGRSSRFGRAKLDEPVDGEPLLWRAVRPLAAVCSELIVVIAPGAPEPVLPADLEGPIAFARDGQPFGGPLVGMAAGLRRASHRWVLIVAGDQPRLRPELLTLLAGRVEAASPSPPAAALVDRDGTLRPLPCVVDRRRTLPVADRLIRSGERRLKTLLAALAAEPIPPADWLRVDPNGEWTLDIDVPADLDSGRRGSQ